MIKIGKWIALFILLILLSSCKKETLGDWSYFYLINMTNDTFTVICNYRYRYEWEGNKIKKFPMFPNDRLYIAEYDLSYDNRHVDSIFIYKYHDTTHVYIRFKYNEEPYNYKLNCFNRSDWRDSVIYYEKNVHTNGLEVYYIIKKILFKIEKDKIINP
jgi:hypothetical protein